MENKILLYNIVNLESFIKFLERLQWDVFSKSTFKCFKITLKLFYLPVIEQL